MIRWPVLAVALAGCSHQPPVEVAIEVPVPCLRAPVEDPTPPQERVTDAQLKRAPTNKYPLLAGLRIEQDRAERRVLRAAADSCSNLPAQP